MILKILYAVDIWGAPKALEATELRKTGMSRAVSKLTSTQRAVALAITGCLWTMPMDLLNLHADLLPIHLEIDKHCHRVAVHIVTLPTMHLLHKPARKCATRSVRRHKSPLHKLMEVQYIAYALTTSKVSGLRHATQHSHTNGHSQSAYQQTKTHPWRKTCTQPEI